MGQRAEALADQFEQAIAHVIATVGQCSDAQWRATCGDEGWSVAATAHHIAAQWPLEKQYISAAAEGRPLPDFTWDQINERNAQHAQGYVECSKEEVLRELREGSREMAAYVRSLSDEQLDRTGALPLAGGAPVSTQQLIEGGILIDHARTHLQSIRAAG